MILVIDNYDSFVYNLVQYIGELGEKIIVRRNDTLTVKEVEELQPTCLVISPGPGRPSDAGNSKTIIRAYKGKVPIFGVCLGHQCIAEVFGARVQRAKSVIHGKVSSIFHDGETIYHDLENPFLATRYHSLIVDRHSLPGPLQLTAWSEEGLVMGIRHPEYAIEGVQFHPESILTTSGKRILENFIERSKP